jgi:serine/threonine protein phosphatase 1
MKNKNPFDVRRIGRKQRKPPACRQAAADLEFMRGFEDRIVVGDYLFVHAGIHPGVPVEEQELSDLRWIRQPFLNHPGDHGHVVVHGHTIFGAADIRDNRIGIDTGAFASGVLTTLCLEGTERRLIETCEVDGAIACTARPV